MQHPGCNIQYGGCVSRYVTPEQLANSRNLQHALSAAFNRRSLNRCPTPARPSDTSRPLALLRHFFARKRCVGIKRACSVTIWRARVRAGLGIAGAPTVLAFDGRSSATRPAVLGFWTLVAVHSNGRSQLRRGRSALRQLMGTRLSPRLCAARDHSHVRATVYGRECRGILLRDAQRRLAVCAAACIHECR